MRVSTVAAIALLLGGAFEVDAQSRPPATTRPTRRPAPAPVTVAGPEVQPNQTADFVVGGVRVILRRNTANDVIAANLYLLGGTRAVPTTLAGLEPFYLSVSEQGTAKYPKAKLRLAMARLGTGIGIDADVDWTMFGLRATSATLDSTWAVFADRLLHPTLDNAEIELLRQQMLSAMSQRADDPESYLEWLADSIAFAGHPYGTLPTGTPETIARITRDELDRYRRTQLVTSRMLLVVVGNVTRAQLERLIRPTLAQQPAGTYAWSLPDTVGARGPALVVVPRNLPTNYLQGWFAGPPAGSPDYEALRLATAVLSGQLFSEVRSRRNLTYAVNAPFKERAIAAAGLYVTTVAPDSVLRIMKQEIDLLSSELITAAGLSQLVNQFITGYYSDHETNADQAESLARATLYRGDWRVADRFIEELRRVAPEDIRRVSERYLKGLKLAYIGNPRRLTRSRVADFD